MIQRQHRKDPGAAAETVDAEALAFQFCRVVNRRVDGESSRQSIDKAGDEDQVGSLGDRSEVRRRHRSPMQQRLSGTQRRHADRAIANLHQGEIETVLAEVALILRDVQRPFSFARRARRDETLVRGTAA